MEKTKRIEWIDELKGFAIFLVVFGHLIQSKMLPVNGWLHSAIYSFHMPLFMFLSGMFAYKALVKNVNEWCIFSINKFLQLIVPCLIFQFISCHLNFTKFIGAMVVGGGAILVLGYALWIHDFIVFIESYKKLEPAISILDACVRKCSVSSR